jgi:hypothetical protein
VAAAAPTPPAASAGNHAPTMASASFATKAGATWSTMVSGKDADGDAMTYTLSGAPTGVKLTASGMLYWVGAVKGTYKFNVVAKDAKGATGTGVMTLVVS